MRAVDRKQVINKWWPKDWLSGNNAFHTTRHCPLPQL